MSRKSINRREFLSSGLAAIAFATLPVPLPAARYVLKGNERNKKMILSFYLDDTNPETVKAGAFKAFVDYCALNGIKGEASFIPGYNGKSIITDNNQNQQEFLNDLNRSWSKGIDTHMEIMTHDTLYDFKDGRKKENGIHEGLWLHEPSVTEQEYRDYFSGILSDAGKKSIKFTGLTWPGCGCETCTRRYEEFRKEGPLHFNPNVFEALLNLVVENKFRSNVIPIFYDSSETEYGIFKRASRGKYGVYELMPNAVDNFGIWENSKDHVDPDYYITEDGKSGIIIRHLENDSPYCIWYMHWQGVNPENGNGWGAFKTVAGRIRKHISDKVEWMRPADIVTAYHETGNWEFAGRI
jgi:hypothetical protein